jgi:hypothetical protein
MQHAQYVRLYADARGETHFEEIDVTLMPTAFAPPAARCMSPRSSPVGVQLRRRARGWPGEQPHPSPRRQLFCNLRGEYEVTAGDGRSGVSLRQRPAAR